MRIRILFIALLFAIPTSLSAQYRIKIDIEGNKDSMLILGNYYLDATYAFDTAYSSKGSFLFEDKERELYDGIYFFANSSGKYAEFILDNERRFALKTKDEDWSKHIETKNSKANKLYFEYMKNNFEFADKAKEISQNKEGLSEAEKDEKMKQLRLKSDSLKEIFLNQNPNHLLSIVLNSTKEIDIPEPAKKYLEDGSLDSNSMQQERYNYYISHYFDNINLGVEGILRTPSAVFFSKYDRYWNEIMKYQHNDTIIKYANHWIDKSRGSKQVFKFFVHDITERFLQSAVMGHEEIYIRMIKKYYESGEADWMGPSDLDKEVARANKWSKTMRGKVLPDIQCPDTNDVIHGFYDLDAKYKVLIFWAYDCGHCSKELPQLYEFYKDNKDVYDVEVMAINSGVDLDKWKEFIRSKKLNWLNVNGLVSNYDWHDYFDMNTTPYIVILDRDNKIIAKRISAGNIQNFIKYYEEGLITL